MAVRRGLDLKPLFASDFRCGHCPPSVRRASLFSAWQPPFHWTLVSTVMGVAVEKKEHRVARAGDGRNDRDAKGSYLRMRGKNTARFVLTSRLDFGLTRGAPR